MDSETPAEVVEHHASRLTAKVIDDDPHRTLRTWVDGMDEERADELVDDIYGAVADEIRSALAEDELSADMDQAIAEYGVMDS